MAIQAEDQHKMGQEKVNATKLKYKNFTNKKAG